MGIFDGLARLFGGSDVADVESSAVDSGTVALAASDKKRVKIPLDGGEQGVVGVAQLFGRYQDRFAQSLQGRKGIQKMAPLLRREAACFTTNRIIQLTAGTAEWLVIPVSDDATDVEAAEFVRSLMDDMSHTWWTFVRFALSAQTFGYSDVEIVWKRRQGRHPPADQAGSAFDDGRIGLRKLAVRRQETIDHWEIDDNGGHQGLVQIDPVDGRERDAIPIEKLLHFQGGDDRGAWEGIGWLEPAYRLAHMVNNYEIIEGIGHQRSHQGLPVMKYDPVEPDNGLIKRLQSLGKGLVVNTKQYVLIPNTVDFELASVTNSNAGELRNKINQLRWDIMMLGLVSFLRLGTTDKGTYSLGESMSEVFLKSINGALGDVQSVLNRHLVPRIIDANAGKFGALKEYPLITVAKVTVLPIQVLSYLQQVQDWFTAAEPVDIVWLRQMMDMPEKSESDIVTEREEAEREAEAMAQAAAKVLADAEAASAAKVAAAKVAEAKAAAEAKVAAAESEEAGKSGESASKEKSQLSEGAAQGFVLSGQAEIRRAVEALIDSMDTAVLP